MMGGASEESVMGKAVGGMGIGKDGDWSVDGRGWSVEAGVGRKGGVWLRVGGLKGRLTFAAAGARQPHQQTSAHYHFFGLGV